MKKLLLILCIIVVPAVLTAQPGPGCHPDCPDAGPPLCPPQCVPIDGGLSLLIAAGIGLGAKKAYDRRKAVKPE